MTTVLASFAGAYLVDVALWPYARCRACRGSQTSHGSNRTRWGLCSRCGGSGERVRFGARLFRKNL